MAKDFDWVAALREKPSLVESLGFRWLSDTESAELKGHWLAIARQLDDGRVIHAPSIARIERCSPLLVGPTRTRRLSATTTTMALVADPAAPDRLWLTLSDAMPAIGWIDTTPDELASVVGAYAADARPAIALSRHDRFVTLLRDVQVTLEAFRNAYVANEPWLDDATWGSAFASDPWLGLEANPSMLALRVHLDRTSRQHGQRPPSIGFRTLWSKSLLTIEAHPFDYFTFDVRYAPVPAAPRAHSALAESLGELLPPDLPIDAALSMLIVGRVLSRESVRRYLEADHLPHIGYLCALDPGEPTTAAELRVAIDRMHEHPQGVGAVADLLNAFGYQALFAEMALSTEDSSLREQITAQLAPAVHHRAASGETS